MKVLMVSLALLFVVLSTHAQVGKAFPLVEGENLNYTEVNLPEDTEGKYTLVAVAFSRVSEQDLMAWSDPIYNHFIRKPDEGQLFAFEYELDVYFLPLITGAKKLGYKSVMNEMQTTVDSLLHQHVLFYEGKSKHYRQPLYYKGEDVPYFYVINPEGNIVYATRGKYNSEVFQKIINAVEPAIK
ncbi:hypothetical protein N7E81_17360 [Reichenbachiella carrageenanivorans]|uniref:ATP10 protein n=1 Tax=Reichenbachiella carrageenanivorans TaxID=2979869 RepID=A0ABY6CYX5_9BACT|nr:hypothetical protein [Reichenbachiella carrageenanivorans]UXX79124.1 hypothetical protein N7E81_17360 [Reichenbachiella carrageenanivorans]